MYNSIFETCARFPKDVHLPRSAPLEWWIYGMPYVTHGATRAPPSPSACPFEMLPPPPNPPTIPAQNSSAGNNWFQMSPPPSDPPPPPSANKPEERDLSSEAARKRAN